MPHNEVFEEEDLSYDEMKRLLQDAATRLQERANGVQELSKFEVKAVKLPSLNAGKLPVSYVTKQGDIASVNTGALPLDEQRRLAEAPREIVDPVVERKRREEEKKATAGKDWFNLPKTDLTPALKRDLQILKMRGAIDPKRHYKKDSGKMTAPEYSQIGTIIEGSTEFYSSRIATKERKKTIVEEVLAGEAETGRLKRKYNDFQATKANGRKAQRKVYAQKRKGVKKGGV